jgi:hypothetical protein
LSPPTNGMSRSPRKASTRYGFAIKHAGSVSENASLAYRRPAVVRWTIDAWEHINDSKANDRFAGSVLADLPTGSLGLRQSSNSHSIGRKQKDGRDAISA